MKKLTLEDKQKIVEMLHKHYTIDPAATAIIDIAADDAEQVAELVLKAFLIIGRPKNEETYVSSGKPTVGDSPFAIVLIDKLSSKLHLVKAIKEATRCGLKEAKDLADSIIGIQNGEYYYNKFEVGPNGKFSALQWEYISKQLTKECTTFEWHFV